MAYYLPVPPHVAAAPAGVIGDVEAFCEALEAGRLAAAWDGLHAGVLDRLDTIAAAHCRFYGNHQPPDVLDEELQWP